MQKAIIVDIDGTLAKNVSRGHYDYSRVPEDEPHKDIIHLVNSFLLSNPLCELLLVSGREDSCRSATLDWLDSNNIFHDELFMRRTGDYRKDYIIKEEIFREHIEPYYTIEFVVDDRNQVVNMWRSIGLRCIQVADGNF